MAYLLFFREPIVTGTSVLGILYKDGIMMAADNLGMEWMRRSR
jgi:20S proteasome alpha/beta subunit